MPKFIIPVQNLPAPYFDGSHSLRFRIFNEDRNSFSEWSTLFVVPSLGQIYPLESTYSLTASTDLVNIYWDTPSIYNTGASAIGASVLHTHESEWKIHDADVFVKFDDVLTPEFIYWGRTKDNSFSIIPYNSATTIRIIIQASCHPPTLSDKFKILDTGVVSLV